MHRCRAIGSAKIGRSRQLFSMHNVLRRVKEGILSSAGRDRYGGDTGSDDKESRLHLHEKWPTSTS